MRSPRSADSPAFGIPALSIRFAAGRWTLRCGSQEVGSLAEQPDLPEMLDVLTEWARAQAWARGWSDNGGPERAELRRALDRLDAPAALREADRAWTAGSRDAALFRDAAHACALLALETPEWDGRSDLIAARGLATLAYARALGSEDPRREACMLAAAMGYSAAARRWARSLAANDPLRLYANGGRRGARASGWNGRGRARASTIATKVAVTAKPCGLDQDAFHPDRLLTHHHATIRQGLDHG